MKQPHKTGVLGPLVGVLQFGVLLFGVMLFGVMLCSCTTTDKTAARRLKPEDFAASGPSQADSPSSPPREAPPPDAAAQADELDSVPTPDEEPQAASLTVSAHGNPSIDMDAMVGQVHGRPIYASQIFEQLDAELATLGRKFPREVFRRRLVSPMPDGTRLIPDVLSGFVINALILGDAEREMNEQQASAVRNLLKERREEIMRMAEGSPMRADRMLKEKGNIGLEHTMEEMRKGIVVDLYVQRKLKPKITVTQRDIKNYYRDHLDEFNEPPGRLVRMITTTSPQTAERIDQRLAQGTPFVEVAGGRLNSYKPDQNGLYAQRAIGKRIFRPDTLNEAVKQLAEGEYSPRLEYDGKFVWLLVEKIESGEGRSLKDAQAEIDKLLRQRQYTRLLNEYRARLLRDGSYTPIDKMTQMLVEIATSRYAIGQ